MDSGVKIYRSYKPLRDRKGLTCKFGELYPVYHEFMVPGDVFKIHADLLIRYQPMVAPSFTGTTARVRFVFVPLRLVVDNIEEIITGSKDGSLIEEELPVCDSVFKNLDITETKTVEKNSLLDIYFGIPAGMNLTKTVEGVEVSLLEDLDKMESSPALYWLLGFLRFWWDYYRDENYYTAFDDFEDFADYAIQNVHKASFQLSVYLKKDRITSAMPWQLKAVAAPTIEVVNTGSILNPGDAYTKTGTGLTNTPGNAISGSGEALFKAQGASDSDIAAANANWKEYWEDAEIILTRAGFNAAQFRDMMQQTRIYERLARCGSRYTEYLQANFGISPADGTLQRSQYVGGFKARVVTTEVVQTAGDTGTSTPVGTLRGHGISHGTATCTNYIAKEFGMMIGVVDTMPDLVWTQGVNRKFTYRKRFDFFNPSFQHLSEQEVRQGELYFDVDKDSNGAYYNDQTLGFQPYAEELRRGSEMMVGDMRDSLAYWNQAIQLSARPQLNNIFLTATTHLSSFNKPFVVNSAATARPIILDCGFLTEAYRPLVKDGTPGLADHN